jgi:hypothetical protein
MTTVHTKKSRGLMLGLAIALSNVSEAMPQNGNSINASQHEPGLRNGAAGHTLSEWIDRTPTLSQSPAVPGAAEDCALVYDPQAHRIVLFGGKNDEDQNMNEVWSFDLAQNLWQKIEAGGEAPPPSEDHVVIYDPISHRMILHGGENGLTTNNTWALDLQAQRWRNMTDSTAPAREDHTAIFDSNNKRMVIFGGRHNDSTFDYINIYEIWALDLNPESRTFEKWQDLTVKEKHAPGRSDHVAVFDAQKNRMIIYGGWDKEAKEYFGDTWAFYFAAPPDTMGRWVKIKTKKSQPPKRRHAVGVYDAAKNWLIICGGFGEEGPLNDVWAFDLAADAWINITPGPQPRIDHQAIYDPRSQRVIMWGGDARPMLKTKLHDLWELQIRGDLPLEFLLPAAKTPVSEKQ